MKQAFTLVAGRGGERLDLFVAHERPELSRSRIQRLIADGLITVNGAYAKPGLRLAAGDRVDVVVPPPEPKEPLPEAIPLSVVYEDDDLLVVDKPPGMTVHPAPGHPRHTLVNAIVAHCPELAEERGTERPGIVHRLDRDTSGLLVVAKSERVRADLVRQFKGRSVAKGYLALVHGRLEPAETAIEAPIGRDPRRRKRMAVVEGGREARTAYRVMRYYDEYSLVKVTPFTGRTHQIRVHLASVGHPVVGDATYGRKAGRAKRRRPLVGRQFLHAYWLGFRHPRDGRYLEFESPLPPDLVAALRRLEAGDSMKRKLREAP
jgi:23S rRNA pseudouridine1911/1915/1917 synthase